MRYDLTDDPSLDLYPRRELLWIPPAQKKAGEGDGKLLLAAALGGAIAVYATMFVLKYRLESCVLMLALPLLAVINVYCFYLGFRGIFLIW